jgi:hypothetical protein
MQTQPLHGATPARSTRQARGVAHLRSKNDHQTCAWHSTGVSVTGACCQPRPSAGRPKSAPITDDLVLQSKSLVGVGTRAGPTTMHASSLMGSHTRGGVSIHEEMPACLLTRHRVQPWHTRKLVRGNRCTVLPSWHVTRVPA